MLNTMSLCSKSSIKWAVSPFTPQAKRHSKAAVLAWDWRLYAVWHGRMVAKFGWRARDIMRRISLAVHFICNCPSIQLTQWGLQAPLLSKPLDHKYLIY